MAVYCIELHQTDEVSLVLNHQLYLGRPVDEQIVSVQKFEVLGCELLEFVKVLGSELRALTIEGNYEPVELVTVLGILNWLIRLFLLFLYDETLVVVSHSASVGLLADAGVKY